MAYSCPDAPVVDVTCEEALGVNSYHAPFKVIGVQSSGLECARIAVVPIKCGRQIGSLPDLICAAVTRSESIGHTRPVIQAERERRKSHTQPAPQPSVRFDKPYQCGGRTPSSRAVFRRYVSALGKDQRPVSPGRVVCCRIEVGPMTVLLAERTRGIPPQAHSQRQLATHFEIILSKH